MNDIEIKKKAIKRQIMQLIDKYLILSGKNLIKGEFTAYTVGKNGSKISMEIK